MSDEKQIAADLRDYATLGYLSAQIENLKEQIENLKDRLGQIELYYQRME